MTSGDPGDSLASGAKPPGWYGKIPCLGDFADRELPREFIDPWDRWLQEGLTIAQSALGDSWQETYLTFPIWRFVLPAGTVDSHWWAGVLMPSVDRVGRLFPLTICAPIPTAAQVLADVVGAVTMPIPAAPGVEPDSPGAEPEAHGAELRQLPEASDSIPDTSASGAITGIALPSLADIDTWLSQLDRAGLAALDAGSVDEFDALLLAITPFSSLPRASAEAELPGRESAGCWPYREGLAAHLRDSIDAGFLHGLGQRSLWWTDLAADGEEPHGVFRLVTGPLPASLVNELIRVT